MLQKVLNNFIFNPVMKILMKVNISLSEDQYIYLKVWEILD